MPDEVWSENSLSIYDLFAYSLCHILGAFPYILLPMTILLNFPKAPFDSFVSRELFSCYTEPG
jgi:hypothetical protein